jgi:hypothetical protein
MTFLSFYKDFINNLDIISQKHDELTDTNVRERLHEVINWYFIWGNKIDTAFPKKYAMFSQEGDDLVSEATITFINEVCPLVKHIPLGQERNDLIENSNMESDNGSAYYFFLGAIDTVIPPTMPTSDDIYSEYDN